MSSDLFQPALAKIGKRYYWAVCHYRISDEDEDTRVADGFTETRTEAVNAAAEVLDRVDPAHKEREGGHQNTWFWTALNKSNGNWNRARVEANGYSWMARRLYKKHHGRKPKPSSNTDARGDDLGFMYTWCEPYDHDMWKPHWDPHRITKITKKRIFVFRDGRSYLNQQYSFSRAEVEHNGCAFFQNGTGSRRFYSEAGKAAQEAKWAEYRREGRSIRSEESNILGISGECTRADIMRAFREKSKEHHPDRGGDPETFRRLVQAKDRALFTARRQAA